MRRSYLEFPTTAMSNILLNYSGGLAAAAKSQLLEALIADAPERLAHYSCSHKALACCRLVLGICTADCASIPLAFHCLPLTVKRFLHLQTRTG